MKVFVLLLSLLSLRVIAEENATVAQKMRTRILVNIYADCFGRRITADELKTGMAMSRQQIIELLQSEQCRSAEARSRREERRPYHPVRRLPSSGGAVR
jgi:hypothetical protein